MERQEILNPLYIQFVIRISSSAQFLCSSGKKDTTDILLLHLDDLKTYLLISQLENALIYRECLLLVGLE